MEAYGEFVDKLKNELNTFLTSPKEDWKEISFKNVNGLAGEELRRLVSLQTRRDFGAFFTDSLLAKKVLNKLDPTFDRNSIIYDPACGAGNLLISVTDYLQELNIDFDEEKNLLGSDLHNEFIKAAKLRLKTNSLLKSSLHTPAIFSNVTKKKYSIAKKNGLLQNSFYKKATHIIVNPPFNQIVPNEKLSWSNGKVSAAALFIDKIIQHSNPGVSIIAILPDVLRSGSRYEKWRAMVDKECIIENILLLGQFDKYADVDVYAVRLRKRQEKSIGIIKLPETKHNNNITTLADLFEICVGPVVDNRDLKKGPSLPYLVSRGLQGWLLQKGIKLKRRHQGKNFTSPFVVVKRTSRMGDSQRAVATIINTPTPTFVDNHLIVLKPKSGTLKDCKKALQILKEKKTDEWLNSKIRCRHLTVKVVAEIPVYK